MMETAKKTVVAFSGLFLCLVGALPNSAEANEILVGTNAPETIAIPVNPGDTSVQAAIDLSGASRYALDVVAPVDGTAITLSDGSGNILRVSSDADVEFISGALVQPTNPLPGGIFGFGVATTPADEELVMQATFPSAPVATAILVTVFRDSAIQVGLAIPGNSFLAGDEFAVGLLVLNDGQPMTGLSPAIDIFEDGQSVAVMTVAGHDDGTDGDGQADDGLYTALVSLSVSGIYEARGSASVEVNGESLQRSASAEFTIVEPAVDVILVSSMLDVDQSLNCVNSISQDINLIAAEAGTFVVASGITLPDDTLIDKRKRVDLTPGANTVTLEYDRDELSVALASTSAVTFAPILILRLGDEIETVGASLPPQAIDVMTTVCTDPVSIGTLTAATPTIVDGSIASISFEIPVTVATAGTYQLSFKLIGSGGENVFLFGARQFLGAGVNEVSFTVDSGNFLAADGPYNVVSGLVTGPAGSASRGNIGFTQSFSRWQFSAARVGDLDNDGAVTRADINIVIEFRNTDALSPGDRRDITGDGRIDIRDARTMVRLL